MELSASELIRAMQAAEEYDRFYRLMYQYILTRYMLDDQVTETNLLMLAKESLRRQTADLRLTEQQLMNSFSKSDCRGTNSIVKKKVLLMMNLEKKLGVHIDDTKSADIDTTHQLAQTLFILLGKGANA